MGISRKILSNSFYLFLNLLVANFLGLLFWFFVGKLLVPEEVGIISTSINFALLLSSISVLGFQGALPKLIPEYLEKKQNSKIVSLSMLTFKTLIISNTVIILFLLASFPAIQSILNLPSNALIFSIVLIIAFTFSNFFGSMMYGFQNMREFFISDTAGTTTKLLLTIFLLFSGYGYTSALVGVLVGYIIISLRRFRKSWFVPFSKEKINSRKIFVDYALPYLTSMLAGLVFSSFQILLLASLRGQYVTGGYSISLLIASLVSVIPGVLSQALFPIISMLSVGNKIKKQSYLLLLVLRYALFFMIPLATFLIFFSRPILLLLRNEYIEVISVLSTLTVASMLFGLGHIFLSSLYAIGKTKLNRNIWIISAILFLITSPIMIYLYSAQGLAISYTISGLLFLILGYYFINKALKLKINYKNMLKLSISFIPLFLLLYLSDLVEASLLIKILIAISGLLVYLISLIPIRFYKREDVRILQIIAEKLPILKRQIMSLAEFLSKWLEKDK